MYLTEKADWIMFFATSLVLKLLRSLQAYCKKNLMMLFEPSETNVVFLGVWLIPLDGKTTAERSPPYATGEKKKKKKKNSCPKKRM